MITALININLVLVGIILLLVIKDSQVNSAESHARI